MPAQIQPPQIEPPAIMLVCHTNDEHSYEYAIAILTLTLDFATLLLQLMAAASMLQGMHSTFHRASFFSSGLLFCSTWRQGHAWEDDDDLGEAVADEINNGAWAVMPSAFVIPDDCRDARSQLFAVNATTVLFRCYIGDDSYDVETPELSREHLLELCKELLLRQVQSELQPAAVPDAKRRSRVILLD